MRQRGMAELAQSDGARNGANGWQAETTASRNSRQRDGSDVFRRFVFG
ncbi:MAG: hypothetical protein IJ523_02945 [Succinivibrionaceae bacterium]|nr:hypothetical protein [Succinivibrionaceae bacterium]